MKDRGLCLQCMCTVFSVNISKVSDWFYQNMNTSVCIKKSLIVFFFPGTYIRYICISLDFHTGILLLFIIKNCFWVKDPLYFSI